MKKWLFPVTAAAVFVIGCGGHGGGGSSSTSGGVAGGVSGDSVAVPNIQNTPALITTTYLTGQGRSAGDIIAYISTPTIIDASGTVEQTVNPAGSLTLDLTGGTLGGTQNSLNINVSDFPNGNSHQFNQYELILNQVGIQNADGSVGTLVPASGTNALAYSDTYPATIGAFPGRQTDVQVYLNDAICNINQGSSGNTVTFSRSLFLQTNTTTDNPYLQGYFSDYLMFDLSHVASLPVMSNSENGTRAYFNGDKIGLSDSTPGGFFQVYTPSVTLTGLWNNPTSLTSFGTYALKEVSPTDITQTITITSLQGTWKPASSCFTGLGTNLVNGTGFELILLPHNTDDNFQDVVAAVYNSSGQITNFYFGLADLNAKTFELFPINQVANGGLAGEVDGTFTSLLDTNGATTTAYANVRSGRYAIAGTLPTGFRASGRFVVYRR